MYTLKIEAPRGRHKATDFYLAGDIFPDLKWLRISAGGMNVRAEHLELHRDKDGEWVWCYSAYSPAYSKWFKTRAAAIRFLHRVLQSAYDKGHG